MIMHLNCYCAVKSDVICRQQVWGVDEGVVMLWRSVVWLLALFCCCNCELMSSSVSEGLHRQEVRTLPNMGLLSCTSGPSSRLPVRKTNTKWGGLFGPTPALCVMLGWINAIGLPNEETAGLCATAAKRWKRKPRGETLTTANWHRDA